MDYYYLNYHLKRNSGKIRSRYYKQYWVIVFFYILMERDIERKKDREGKNRRQ